MSDEELNALIRTYVYTPIKDEPIAAQLLEQIKAEYARRGVAIYQPEE